MLHRFFTSALAAVSVSAALACGSSSAVVEEPASDPAAQPGEAAAAGDGEIVTLCASLFARQYECTDEYIPMLVDQRIELDIPPGIAQQGATPEGRDALIETAKQEWAVDGAEPGRTQGCQKIVAALTPEIKAQAEDMANECLAKDSCTDLVACVAPFQRERLAAAKAQMGQ